MLLLSDGSKLSMSVTMKPKNRFWVTIIDALAIFKCTKNLLKYFLHHHQKILKYFLLNA